LTDSELLSPPALFKVGYTGHESSLQAVNGHISMIREDRSKLTGKRVVKVSGNLFIWILGTLISALAALLFNDSFPSGIGGDVPNGVILLAACLIGGLFILLFWLFLCWLCRWRNLKRAAAVCGCVALVYLAFRLEENWRGRRAWERFAREWTGKGEAFDFQSLVPPQVPADRNFAMAPIVVSCYSHLLDSNGHPFKPAKTNIVNRLALSIYPSDAHGDAPKLGDWEKGTLTDLKAWQLYYRDSLQTNAAGEITHEFPVPPEPRTPAADVLLALSKYDGALQELSVASRLPASRFPLDYGNESTIAILLPHLASMKGCARTLELRALAELEMGQADKACDDTLLIFQLAEKIHNEPFFISQLVRLAILQFGVQGVYEGLANHGWSTDELTKLEAEISRLNIAADCKFAMRGEMAEQVNLIGYFRNHPGEVTRLSRDTPFEAYSPTLVDRLVSRAIPPGWYYQNQVNCARLMVENVIPIANETSQTFSVKLRQQVDAALSSFTPSSIFHYMDRWLIAGLGRGCEKFALCQNALNLATTAMASEQYRMSHGFYPESLDTLGQALPHDAIGGQPLKYHREPDGEFVLYSIGWNEIDDGGIVVFEYMSTNRVDIDKGDWVWRYPKN
jgi:hypothetical protein